MLSHSHTAYKQDTRSSLGCFATASFLKASEQALFFSGFLSKQCYWPLKLWAFNEVQQQSHFCGSTICTFSPRWQWEKPNLPLRMPLWMTFLQSTRLWAPVASSSLPLAALGDSVLTVCIQMCLLTEYLAGSPEMISRYLAFKILYRL